MSRVSHLLALCVLFLGSCNTKEDAHLNEERAPTSFADLPRNQAGTFCWPMHYAGVVAGISTDENVVRLLGNGAYRSNEGYGVRYYINAAWTATLRIATFTDNVVGEISIQQDIVPGLSAAEIQSAITPDFSPGEGFGKWHELSLGSSKEQVAENLGPPARRDGEDVWVYDAARTCEIPEDMTLTFASGKIVKILFSAPCG